MNQQFLTFHLEDKVNLKPSGVVKPPIIHTYKRKGRKVIERHANYEGMSVGKDRD